MCVIWTWIVDLLLFATAFKWVLMKGLQTEKNSHRSDAGRRGKTHLHMHAHECYWNYLSHWGLRSDENDSGSQDQEEWQSHFRSPSISNRLPSDTTSTLLLSWIQLTGGCHEQIIKQFNVTLIKYWSNTLLHPSNSTEILFLSEIDIWIDGANKQSHSSGLLVSILNFESHAVPCQSDYTNIYSWSFYHNYSTFNPFLWRIITEYKLCLHCYNEAE